MIRQACTYEGECTGSGLSECHVGACACLTHRSLYVGGCMRTYLCKCACACIAQTTSAMCLWIDKPNQKALLRDTRNNYGTFMPKAAARLKRRVCAIDCSLCAASWALRHFRHLGTKTLGRHLPLDSDMRLAGPRAGKDHDVALSSLHYLLSKHPIISHLALVMGHHGCGAAGRSLLQGKRP